MKYRKLSELCEYASDKILVSILSRQNYISTENMLQNRGGICDAEILPSTLKVSNFAENDILISNIRPYFKKIWRAKFCGGCSNDILVMRAKQNCNPIFLYYILSSDSFFSYATHTSKGTKMPRGDKKAIMNYQVPDLSYQAQKIIGEFLNVFDRKIELNNKLNDNLEQQAQAIYVNMFIDNIDSEWQQGHLSDLITVRYGKDHKKLANGSYPVFGSGGLMRRVERPLYDKESVLIPRKGTLNNVMYVNEPFWSVDTMFYSEMRLPNIAKFVYHFVKSQDLSSMNTGSAVPSMTTDILKSMKIVIPSVDALARFENTISPLYMMIQENEKQNLTLIKLRDILLPKLMSGELDVSELDI